MLCAVATNIALVLMALTRTRQLYICRIGDCSRKEQKGK